MNSPKYLFFSVCVTVIASLFAAPVSAAPILISDDFESDTSANYTVVDDGTADGTSTFAFDYIGAGLPLAPHSTAGDTGGLRLTSNDTAGATDAITAFHNTAVTADEYHLSVDVYMGVTGTGGTTEHAHVGVAGDGATFNSLFSPISGSGHFLAFTGEGGSSSDYRHSRPAAIGGLTNSGDPSYLNSDHTTNATGDTYQAIFPSPPYDFAGSPGNAWTTLEILVADGLIRYYFDGTPIIRSEYSDADGDQVSLGNADLFTSLAAPFQSQFVVYDNLTVTMVPEPTTAVLLLLAAASAVCGRRRYT